MRSAWLEKLLCALSGALMLAVSAFVAFRWRTLPEQLPTHYNAAGVADSFGGRGSLLVLLAVAWASVLLMVPLLLIPGLWEKAQGSQRGIRATRGMTAWLTLVLSLMFGYIILCTAQCRALGVWFLPVTMVLIFGIIIVGSIMAARK